MPKLHSNAPSVAFGKLRMKVEEEETREVRNWFHTIFCISSAGFGSFTTVPVNGVSAAGFLHLGKSLKES